MRLYLISESGSNETFNHSILTCKFVLRVTLSLPTLRSFVSVLRLFVAEYVHFVCFTYASWQS